MVFKAFSDIDIAGVAFSITNLFQLINFELDVVQPCNRSVIDAIEQPGIDHGFSDEKSVT